MKPDQLSFQIPDWKSRVGRMRLVGILEGVSFLILMGVAMPLKYLADMPAAVTYTGWIHGLLFICYCMTILIALVHGRISWKTSVMAFAASLFPFGPFVFDRKFAEDEAVERQTNGPTSSNPCRPSR